MSTRPWRPARRRRAVDVLHARLAESTDGRWAAAARHAARCVESFDGWCQVFLAAVRSRYRAELGDSP